MKIFYAFILLGYFFVQAQIINHKVIDKYLIEGEVGKAQKSLESYLGSKDLNFQDSIYILKNLGVLYSSSPKRKDLGDKYFSRLLDLDPFASIHDTYASNTILMRFKKIRKTYQIQKGGKALVPTVVVFDFTGEGAKGNDAITMAQQLIVELQRLEVFHTLDRNALLETMSKMRMDPEKCMDRVCRLDIARRLTADKMVLVESTKLDSVYTFNLSFFDVESGDVSTTITKVYSKSVEKLMSDGFGELAVDLMDHEAAWLNLSVTPSNIQLTIDGSPMAAIASRVPLNPGKHVICGDSPGYEPSCKNFEVKKADALTYALILQPKNGSAAAAKPKTQDEESEDEVGSTTEASVASSHKFVWWTLGAMGLLAITLALLFNTKN